MKYLYVHLRSGNTPSGNPQRLYVIYDAATGAQLEIIDEGYSGLPEKLRYPHGQELLTVEVPKAEYHRLKNGRQLWGKRR